MTKHDSKDEDVVKNSIQPLVKDEHGRERFKENKIVSFLLDNGGFDMNNLACMDFSENDREHFAQLIGYSLDGFGMLSYVSDETYYLAEKQRRPQDAESELVELRKKNALFSRLIKRQGEHLKSKDERIAELEQVMFDLLSLSSFHMSFPFEAERLEDLKPQQPEVK